MHQVWIIKNKYWKLYIKIYLKERRVTERVKPYVIYFADDVL